MTRKNLSKIAFGTLAASFLVGTLFINSSTLANFGGGTIAGNYIWLDGARTDSRQAVCDANFSDRDCHELCMYVGNNTPVTYMDRYCCLEPGTAGGLDSPQECDFWVN